MGVQIKKTDEKDKIETEQESKSSLETESETSLETEETESELSSETEGEPETTEKVNDSEELIDGLHPEFKEAMDSYEEFINEYCEFMKKYDESDGNDVGLFLDYADYLGKYAEALEDFEAWDSEELNMAELSYYSEVQIRTSKKILEWIE